MWFGEATQREKPAFVEHRVDRWYTQIPERSVFHQALSWLEKPDLTERLFELAAPTLILCGEEDVRLRKGRLDEMRANLQQAKLVRIPGAGHTSNLGGVGRIRVEDGRCARAQGLPNQHVGFNRVDDVIVLDPIQDRFESGKESGLHRMQGDGAHDVAAVLGAGPLHRGRSSVHVHRQANPRPTLDGHAGQFTVAPVSLGIVHV